MCMCLPECQVQTKATPATFSGFYVFYCTSIENYCLTARECLGAKYSESGDVVVVLEKQTYDFTNVMLAFPVLFTVFVLNAIRLC